MLNKKRDERTMDQHIARIVSQIPGWSVERAVVTPLLGGITNQNYRVDIDGGSFVLRVGGKGTHLLGIDRERESICSMLASDIGVAPHVLHFLPGEDALVTYFITGTPITAESAAQPEILRRIVSSMQRYHAGRDFPGAFSPFETVRNYHQLALQYGVTFPDTLPGVFALMARIEEALRPVQQSKPCHNDLLATNFIDDGSTIWIIDWEYAGMGDPFFDLGNFTVNQALDSDGCELFLRYYFGEVRRADLAHLHLMRLGSDLRESFWGFLQMGISELDFDYREYAHHHLNRFLHNVENSPFEKWLEDIKM
jgi:thiamine kinase-like enzyme